MTTATSPTDAGYLDSIQDPFFKSLAQQAIPKNASTDNDDLPSAATRLEDLEMAVRKPLFDIVTNA